MESARGWAGGERYEGKESEAETPFLSRGRRLSEEVERVFFFFSLGFWFYKEYQMVWKINFRRSLGGEEKTERSQIAGKNKYLLYSKRAFGLFLRRHH